MRTRVFLALTVVLVLAACDPKVATDRGFFPVGTVVTLVIDGSVGRISEVYCSKHGTPNCYYNIRFSADRLVKKVWGHELAGWQNPKGLVE